MLGVVTVQGETADQGAERVNFFKVQLPAHSTEQWR